jgi:hypothetical protein
MTAQRPIDIAFDWDSNPKGGYDGFVLLGPSGFLMDVPGGPPGGSPAVLRQGDQLEFVIYDISDQAASRTVSDVQIWFQAAHAANTADYPFPSSAMGGRKNGWYPLADLTVTGPASGGESGVFGGPYPVWRVAPTTFDLDTPGWYFFRVELQVATGNRKKSFGNDPEMIVDPSG